MTGVVDFFTYRFDGGGRVLVALIFFALAILGVIMSTRGRGAMVWIVGVGGFLLGILLGAMAGIMLFNSLIAMTILASVFGVLLLFLVMRVKSIGYFIGIATLSWFLAYIVTSEMYVKDTSVSRNTILFIDMAIGIIMGFLAALRSKYLVSVVTAIAGGLLSAISALAIFGVYFADYRTCLIAGVISAFGLFVQITTYDLKPTKRKKKRR